MSQDCCANQFRNLIDSSILTYWSTKNTFKKLIHFSAVAKQIYYFADICITLKVWLTNILLIKLTNQCKWVAGKVTIKFLCFCSSTVYMVVYNSTILFAFSNWLNNLNKQRSN